jgi:hypothetical protein
MNVGRVAPPKGLPGQSATAWDRPIPCGHASDREVIVANLTGSAVIARFMLLRDFLRPANGRQLCITRPIVVTRHLLSSKGWCLCSATQRHLCAWTGRCIFRGVPSQRTYPVSGIPAFVVYRARSDSASGWRRALDRGRARRPETSVSCCRTDYYAMHCAVDPSPGSGVDNRFSVGTLALCLTRTSSFS